MKFEPRYLFLFTAIVCLFHLLYNFYIGPEYDSTFWIALFWVFAGFFLFKYPPPENKKK